MCQLAMNRGFDNQVVATDRIQEATSLPPDGGCIYTVSSFASLMQWPDAGVSADIGMANSAVHNRLHRFHTTAYSTVGSSGRRLT